MMIIFLNLTGYSSGSENVVFIKAFEKYFQEFRPSTQRKKDDEKRSCKVDVQHLLENKDVLSVIPELNSLIITSPQRMIDCIGIAIHQVNVLFYF